MAAPQITFVIDVLNDDGGSCLPSDFAITLTGADGTHNSGVDYTNGNMEELTAGIEYTVTALASTQSL